MPKVVCPDCNYGTPEEVSSCTTCKGTAEIRTKVKMFFMDCPNCSRDGIFNSAVKFTDGTMECGICEMGLEPLRV